jgi:hypothetical protein
MKSKVKWFLLASAAILISIIAALSTGKNKDANSNPAEEFNSKEECYEAMEKYKAECIKSGKIPAECASETYCDSRGCC